MKTAIVYNAERLSVNGFFANALARELSAQIVDETVDDSFDLYLIRTENVQLRQALERRGKYVSNNAETGRVGNDKHLSYQFAAERGIRFLPYRLIRRGDSVTFPCVVKSRFGHGGKQVFWVRDSAELARVFASLPDETLIAQRPSETLGRDLRVYVLGGHILQGMLRENAHSFKSNFTLGGSCRPFPPSKEIEDMALCLARELKADFVGVDFLFDGDTPVFNELEDVVGTRMLYQTGMDAAARYASYLKEKLNLE